MNPVDDTFISASLDGTVRMWDLDAPSCLGLLRRKPGHPSMVCFNPDGSVFALAVSNNTVKLYAREAYDAGPFLSFQVSYNRELEWLGISFSPDGKNVLLSSVEALFLYDSFKGTHLGTFKASESLRAGSFSPNGAFLFAGTSLGNICVWTAAVEEPSVHFAKPFHIFQGHPGPVGSVAWNPSFFMFASACQSLYIWQ